MKLNDCVKYTPEIRIDEKLVTNHELQQICRNIHVNVINRCDLIQFQRIRSIMHLTIFRRFVQRGPGYQRRASVAFRVLGLGLKKSGRNFILRIEIIRGNMKLRNIFRYVVRRLTV